MRKVIRNIAIVVSIFTISLILSASGGNQNGIGGGKGANGSGGKNAWVGNKPQYVMDSSLQILLDERDFVNLTVMSCIT